MRNPFKSTRNVLQDAAQIIEERGMCTGVIEDDGNVCVLGAIYLAEGRKIERHGPYVETRHVKRFARHLAKECDKPYTDVVWSWSDKCYSQHANVSYVANDLRAIAADF